MYKVFINEKQLSITAEPLNIDKNIPYESTATLEMAVDLLENTGCGELCIFGGDPDMIWKDFRNHFTTIEAAGGVVYNNRGEVLFIYRLGRWDLPKGKTEIGESISETALREVEEECGISGLHLEEFLGSTYHMYRNKSQPILKITHWFRMECDSCPALTPQHEEGISKAEWKNPQQITDDVLPGTFRNIKIVLDAARNGTRL